MGWLLLVALASGAAAQTTAIETSFEAAEGYPAASVNGRNGWAVASGTAAVTSGADYVEDGAQGLRVSTSGRLRVDHVAFDGREDGIPGVVYTDLWVNVRQLSAARFTLSGVDLYGGSRKRAFVIDFDTPAAGTGQVRIFDTFTAVPIGSYTVGAWTRITVRTDFEAGTYQVSLNAAEPVAVAFRESYTPSASGNRTGGERQYHALTLNLGSDDTSGSADVGIDRLAVGTEAPAGVTFPEVVPQYPVVVFEPSAGAVALSPAGTAPDDGPGVLYDEGTVVTATVTPDDGFVACGWTGDSEAEAAEIQFTVTDRLAFRPFVCADPNAPPETRVVTVASGSALEDALENARPGDVIEMANGTYDIGLVSIREGGVEGHPVTVRAQTVGGVTLTGESAFAIKQAAHVTIQGFVFASTDVTAVKLESASHARITQNVFRLGETASLKWIVVGGTSDLWVPFSDHNRIDHNRFEDKAELGNFITIDGSEPPNALSSQYDRIDHNHFLRTGPRATNEKEAVRVGWSAMSLSSGFTTVEHNLFEACDGDPEIISVKTSDAVVRYNTFRRSQGTLSVRHGNRTLVEGNVFLGEGREGTGGIRFYGDDHVIVNNVMTGLTGTRFDAPLAVTNGDADYGSTTDLTRHFTPQRALIAHNTLVGNTHGIEIGYTGSGYTRPPRQITFANNVVEGAEADLIHVYTAPTAPTWRGNLMWPTGTAALGVTAPEAQIRVADPGLAGGDLPWLLAAGSPAIDAAASGPGAPALDVQGQTRVTPDVGADEYDPSAPVLYAPLTAADVGPEAVGATASEPRDPARRGLSLALAGPNPVRTRTTLLLTVEAAASVEVALFDALGRRVAVLHEGPLAAGGHPLALDAASLASGVYLVRAATEAGMESQTLTVVR
ncbi:MAG: chondroitinase-B domain-containing protein [Bacteroidota bacterium]